jgi:porin
MKALPLVAIVLLVGGESLCAQSPVPPSQSAPASIEVSPTATSALSAGVPMSGGTGLAQWQAQPGVALLDPTTPSVADSANSLQMADPGAGQKCDTCFDTFWTRPTLTGDWGGLRPRLKDCGFTFGGNMTQFGFGLGGGVYRPVFPALEEGNTFKYTGRNEYEMTVDLEKFGGMPKGTLFVRAQQWYGQYGNVSANTGSFPPAIFPAALPPAPNNEGMPYITDFLLTQPLSKNWVVFAGKKNVIGAADQDDFAGGNGTAQFMNQAFIANPAFLLGLPYSSFTAGVVSPREWGGFSAYVFDPQDRTREFFKLDDLFSKGVIVGGEVKVKTNFFSLPGEQHVGAMWKHVELTDLRFNEPPPGVYPEPVVPGFPTLKDSYTIYHGFDQYLRVYSEDSKRGWGLFGRASISDGNPTPVKYFLSGGIGGYSPFAYKRGDTFGIGVYYVGASQEFGPLPRALVGPRDGYGVELFYNFQLTPWMNLTPDFQMIRPEGGALANNSYIGGFRLNMKF